MIRSIWHGLIGWSADRGRTPRWLRRRIDNDSQLSAYEQQQRLLISRLRTDARVWSEHRKVDSSDLDASQPIRRNCNTQVRASTQLRASFGRPLVTLATSVAILIACIFGMRESMTRQPRGGANHQTRSANEQPTLPLHGAHRQLASLLRSGSQLAYSSVDRVAQVSGGAALGNLAFTARRLAGVPIERGSRAYGQAIALIVSSSRAERDRIVATSRLTWRSFVQDAIDRPANKSDPKIDDSSIRQPASKTH